MDGSVKHQTLYDLYGDIPLCHLNLIGSDVARQSKK